MARLPRLYIPGCPQHVIQRGNNRAPCFYHDADYKAYLSFLKDAAVKYQVDIHAFVLMTNHVHLLVTPHDAVGVSQLMQALGRKYVQYFNYSYVRTGTLWEGRYKSTVVDSENYLFKVYRYIELNPVRAAMVSHAAEYPWSSYQRNALGKLIQLITPHPLYCRLGHSDIERQQAYRSMFSGPMSDADVVTIREATNKSWVLGDEQFKALTENSTGRRAMPLGRGGDRKSNNFRNS